MEHGDVSVCRRYALPALAMLAGLLLTAYLAYLVKSGVEQSAEREFLNDCDQVQLRIEGRLQAHKQVLLGAAALFDASSSVERDEWRAYAKRVQIDRHFNGIQGLGFVQSIPREKLSGHIAEIRRQGFPEYTVHPAGDRSLYSSVIYLEPFDWRNQRDFGFDMYAEPVRRKAMEQARDKSDAALSGKVRLMQETGKDVQAGTLMYLPVYRKGLPVDTVEQRRAALFGWVYSPFRMDDMLNGVLQGWDDPHFQHIHLNVYDGLEPDPENLIFQRQSELRTEQIFTHRQQMIFNGRIWTLVFEGEAGGLSGIDYSKVWIASLSGGGASLLLFFLVLSYLNTRCNAARIARELTAELRGRTSELTMHNLILQQIDQGVVVFEVLEELAWHVELQHPGMLCSILLLDEDGRHLRHGAAPSLPDAYNRAIDGVEIGEGVGSCGTAAYRGERVIVADIQTHPYWAGYRELAQQAGVQACWSQPVKSSDGRVLGTFAIYHAKPTQPEEDEIRMIERYAELAALAIERARVQDDLHLKDVALNSSANTVVITDKDGIIKWANRAFEKLTGYASGDAVGRQPRELLKSGKHPASFYEELWKTILSGQVWHGEIVNRRKNGSLYSEEMTITPVLDKQGRISHFIAIKQDISERKRAEDKVRMLAFYDELTRLPNRRLLQDRLDRSMTGSKRSGCYGALMFMDMDNFKPLNDGYGHDVGDLLLIQVAERIQGCLRESDTVARFGGDEFVVILDELDADMDASFAEAGAVAEKIRSRLAEPYSLIVQREGLAPVTIEHHCTSSIGVVMFMGHEASQEDLLKWADIAMYQAKEQGRNRVNFHAS